MKSFLSDIQGFTLIEVLIALVILAISLTAVTYAISRNAQNAAYVDQKMAAHWVAMNVISREQVQAEQSEFTPATQAEGQTKMLNHTWYWQSKIEAVGQDEQTYHMSVAVSAEEDGPPVEQLDGFFYHIPTNDDINASSSDRTA